MRPAGSKYSSFSISTNFAPYFYLKLSLTLAFNTNTMANINIKDKLVTQILNELESLDEEGKRKVLKKAQTLNFIKTSNEKKSLTPIKKEKAPSMSQIDKWKHEARKLAKQQI